MNTYLLIIIGILAGPAIADFLVTATVLLVLGILSFWNRINAIQLPKPWSLKKQLLFYGIVLLICYIGGKVKELWGL